MRDAPPTIVQQMADYAQRHGNAGLARALEEGELRLVFIDGPRGAELRACSSELVALLGEAQDPPPSSVGEFWGTWSGNDWAPSLEAACRIGARNQTDRVIVNDQAAQLFLYGRDILGGSVIHRDDGLRRGSIAWVTDRHLNVLGLARVVDSWHSRGPVLRPEIDLGWYLREGG